MGCTVATASLAGQQFCYSISHPNVISGFFLDHHGGKIYIGLLCFQPRVMIMPMPLEILEKTLNKKIVLLLKDGRKLTGTLTGYDDYMNMVLSETEEDLNEVKKRLGMVVLRGNNVVSIAPL